MKILDIEQCIRETKTKDFRFLTCPVVYFMIDSDREIIYIGKSGAEKSVMRFKAHLQQDYFVNVAEIKVICFENEIDSLIYELYALNQVRPKLNSQIPGGKITIDFDLPRWETIWQDYYRAGEGIRKLKNIERLEKELAGLRKTI